MSLLRKTLRNQDFAKKITLRLKNMDFHSLIGVSRFSNTTGKTLSSLALSLKTIQSVQNLSFSCGYG